MSSLSQFFMGTPASFEQRSRLGPSQMQNYNNLQSAAQGPGASGTFGDAADYYRNLLSSNPSSLNAYVAPEMRRFNQDIIPGIAERFAGYGSFGGLNSSGFRNATLNAGTDLAERIAKIRADLQSQGAQGLTGIGQQSLGEYFNNFMNPRSPGFAESAAPGIGQGATQLLSHYLQSQGKDSGVQGEEPGLGGSLLKALIAGGTGFATGGPVAGGGAALLAFLPYIMSLFKGSSSTTGTATGTP